MPSSRRVKLAAVAAVTIVLIILYLNSSSYSVDSQSRYLKALKDVSEKERLAKQQTESLVPPPDHAQDLTDSAGVQERLKEAEDAAKKAAAEKAGPKPDSPRKVEEVMKGRVGGKKDPAGLNEKEKEQEKVAVGPEPEPPKVYDPLVEIAEILKRSPIVIFSKSWCRYSAAAKELFLVKYNITPPPFVVELDQHEHGVELQAALGKQTGRKTVPNIMISGKSVGGCDDVLALESEGTLIDTIQKMGGKRIMKILKLQG